MKQKRIIKNSLKKLVNRFGREDFVSALIQNPDRKNLNDLPLNEIKDNHYLKKAKLDERKIIGEQVALKDNATYDPIIVRKYHSDYEIIVGRVKYFAAKREKMESLSTVVVQLDDEESLLFMLKEVKSRKKINVYELALICEALKEEFSYRNKDLADLLDTSYSQISNLLQILNLPQSVLDDVSMNKLSYGHARCISRVKEDEVYEIVEEIYDKKLSVREVEKRVRSLKNPDQNIENVPIIEEEVPVNEKKEEVSKEEGLTINGLSVTLTFKDQKSFDKGIKRLNKYIKRKRLVIK